MPLGFENERQPQRGDIFVESAVEMNSSSVRSGIWWGEATDEPAREDARPTEDAAPTGRGNWVARVATKISLRTERRPTPTELRHSAQR